MSPIGAFQRPDGEHVIVHRCLACEIERFNRIAGDDDFDLVLSLPLVPPRTSRSVKAAQWQDWQATMATTETGIESGDFD